MSLTQGKSKVHPAAKADVATECRALIDESAKAERDAEIRAAEFAHGIGSKS